MCIHELQNDLAEEKKRPWWRNASDLAKVPLSVLQNAAIVMLPVLSNQLAKSTSTSDIGNQHLGQGYIKVLP